MVPNSLMPLTPPQMPYPLMGSGFEPWLWTLGKAEFRATVPLSSGFGHVLEWVMERALGLYLD